MLLNRGNAVTAGRVHCSWFEHGRSDPSLGTVWTDTTNPVYQIEINEKSTSALPLPPRLARDGRHRVGYQHQLFWYLW